MSVTERRALEAVVHQTALYSKVEDQCSLERLRTIAGLKHARRLRPALRALAYRGLIDYRLARDEHGPDHRYGTWIGLRPESDVGTTDGPISRAEIRRLLELDRGTIPPQRWDQTRTPMGPDSAPNGTRPAPRQDQQWSHTVKTVTEVPVKPLPDPLSTESGRASALSRSARAIEPTIESAIEHLQAGAPLELVQAHFGEEVTQCARAELDSGGITEGAP